MTITITAPEHILRKTITALRQRQHRLEHLSEIQFNQRSSSLSRRENEDLLSVGNIYRREAGELEAFADELCELVNVPALETLHTLPASPF